jgi:translation initiation factor 4E
MLSTKEIMLLLVSSVLVSSDQNSRPKDEHRQSSKREDQESDEMDEAAMISDAKGGALQPQFTKPLDTKWTFWYESKAKRDKGRNLNKTDYLKEVKRGKTFDTISSFWDCWSEVQRVCNSADGDCNYELFRHGVKPVWEDPRNIKGGKCVLVTTHTTHEETMKHWVALMITLLIGEFGPDVNGVVVSTRAWGNMFAVWVRNSKDKDSVDATMKQLQDLFGPNTQIRFQRHQASMRKKFNNGKPSSVIPTEKKQPGESEVSSSPEGEQRDKYKGKEQPRRSVVTAETKGMLHHLIQEATEAPLQPPIDKVNHKEKEEVDRSAPAPLAGGRSPSPSVVNSEKAMESSVERIPSYLGPPKKSTPNNKPIVRKEVPQLSDLSAQQIGIGLAILVAGVAVSILSWTYL